jgi:hypothetical protein
LKLLTVEGNYGSMNEKFEIIEEEDRADLG